MRSRIVPSKPYHTTPHHTTPRHATPHHITPLPNTLPTTRSLPGDPPASRGRPARQLPQPWLPVASHATRLQHRRARATLPPYVRHTYGAADIPSSCTPSSQHHPAAARPVPIPSIRHRLVRLPHLPPSSSQHPAANTRKPPAQFQSPPTVIDV